MRTCIRFGAILIDVGASVIDVRTSVSDVGPGAIEWSRLAPVPYRGKRNEPSHVALTVARVAQARGVDVDVMGSLTLSNTQRLFGLADAENRT